MKHIKQFKDFTLLEYVNTNGRNKDYNKVMFDNAAKFYIKELFGTNNVNITISFAEVNKGSFGDIDLFDTINNIKNKTFDLRLDKNSDTQTLLKALAHELTHIKQVYTNELSISPDNNYIKWKGMNHTSVANYNNILKNKNMQAYVKLPWEADAYQNQEVLAAKFLANK
jgi:hypothetical protein